MDVETTPDRQQAAPTNRQMFLTWLPLSSATILINVEDPIYISVIMHAANPDVELAAFMTYGWAIMGVLSATVYAMDMVSSSFGTTATNFKKIMGYAVGIGTVLTAVMAGLASSSTGSALLQTLVKVPPTYVETVQRVLLGLCFYPLVAAVNLTLQGLLIRLGFAKHIFWSKGVRFAAGTVVLGIGFETQFAEGAIVGVTAMMAGAVLQVLYLAAVAIRPYDSLKRNPLEQKEISPAAMLLFILPLLVFPLFESASKFALAASIGRMPDQQAALVVWPVVINFVIITISLGATYNLVTIRHYNRKGDLAALSRFGIFLAIALSSVHCLTIVTGVFRFVVESLENVDPKFIDVSTTTMWILAPAPALNALNAFYIGLLAREKKTVPIAVAEVVSFCAILLVMVVAIQSEAIQSVFAVALATDAAYLLSLVWLWAAWRKYSRADLPGQAVAG